LHQQVGDDADDRQGHKHACGEEGDSEHGHAPATLAELQAIARYQLERLAHRRIYRIGAVNL